MRVKTTLAGAVLGTLLAFTPKDSLAQNSQSSQNSWASNIYSSQTAKQATRLETKITTYQNFTDIPPGKYKIKDGSDYALLVSVYYSAFVPKGQNRPNVRSLTRTELVNYIKKNYSIDVSGEIYYNLRDEIIAVNDDSKKSQDGLDISSHVVAKYIRIKDQNFTEQVLRGLEEVVIDSTMNQK